MSTVTLERPDTVGDSLFDVPGDGSTLETLVSRVWEGLSSGESTACLVCGGEVEAVFIPGDGVDAGHCHDCHASLS